MREIIIGADGGGTKTKYIAFDLQHKEVVGESSGKSINSYTLGLQAATQNFCAGIHSLNLSEHDRVVAISIGDPAMDDSGCDEHAAALRSYIAGETGFGDDTLIVSRSDVFMALYGLSAGDPAVLIVSGTGSMGVALKEKFHPSEDVSVLTAGGWGFPSNDRGSGYDIAVRGIMAAMDTFDGIASGTDLCDEVLKFFQADSPRDLIGLLNGTPLEKSRIAAFAVCVDRCAQRGDATAAQILGQAGEDLGRYAISLVRQIEEPRCQIGIYGSVLLKNRRVREAFEHTVKQTYPLVHIRIPAFPPEYGAVRYAIDILRHTKGEQKYE